MQLTNCPQINEKNTKRQKKKSKIKERLQKTEKIYY